MIKEEVEIDNRIHKYIIGRRGDEIKKIQKKFNVELRLPRDGDPNPDLVTVSFLSLYNGHHLSSCSLRINLVSGV